MGNLPLNHRNKRFKQGFYKPKNPKKFISKDGKHAIYRSGLELKYFRLLDLSDEVKYWGSEEVIIPYKFNDKWHKYYIDLYVELVNGKKMFIEIKPYAQTQVPNWSKRRKKEVYLRECNEYAKNKAKWTYAIEAAKKINADFKILTEKDFNL